MIHQKLFLKVRPLVFITGTLILSAMTGCVTYEDRPSPRTVYVEPAPARTVVVVQDDYDYYPRHQVYYSRHRHQYLYVENGRWISRSEPRGVSVNVLLGSPSVRMNFHDSPSHHHSTVVRTYPKNWSNNSSHKNRKDDRKSDKHDDHHENHRN